MKVFVSLTQAEAARYSQFWQRQYGSPRTLRATLSRFL
jgi:hypothetical protein